MVVSGEVPLARIFLNMIEELKSRFWDFLSVQGDQKSRPPLLGRDEKCSGKMEYSIFKYNLFKYYLENFAPWNPLHKMLGQFSQKMVLYGIYRVFAN